jgi:predicted PurR-regulated permease PerM
VTVGTAGWRSRDIVRAAALVVGVIAAARGFWAASTVIFAVFLGVLFGLGLTAGVDRLERIHVPRAVAAPGLLLAILGAFVGLGALTAPTLTSQVRELQSRAPEAIDQVVRWANTRFNGALGTITGQLPGAPNPASPAAPQNAAPAVQPAPPPTAAPTPTPTPTHTQTQAPPPAAAPAPQPEGKQQAPAAGLGARLTESLGPVVGRLFGFVGSTIEVVVYALLILFVAIYVAADPELYHRGIMHLVPHRARARVGDVLTAIAQTLRQWLLTQFIAMAVLAIVWAIALSILKVKAALALAVIAGLLEFIPTIGPTLAVVPALAMALVDSPTKALSVLICYLVIQAIEANVLIPLLMQGRIDLPPAVTITAQALMTLAFGFLGLMVAVPILAAFMVGIKMLYVEDVVGDAMPAVDRALAEARSG